VGRGESNTTRRASGWICRGSPVLVVQDKCQNQIETSDRERRASMSEHLLTLHEASILSDLAEAWNRYTLLPDHGPDDVNDFKKAVHDAQRIVLARTGRRQLQGVMEDLPWEPE